MPIRPKYSIVAPVYNEEGNLSTFYQRVADTMNALGDEWELVLVNDGSRDSSLDIMQSWRKVIIMCDTSILRVILGIKQPLQQV